jgi:hypothetical protein
LVFARSPLPSIGRLPPDANFLFTSSPPAAADLLPICAPASI